MKNGGVFETDLARKSGGFICVLIGHLQGWFCHVFSGELDSEIQRDGVADDTSATTGQLLTVFCFINMNLTQFQIAVYYNLITF